MWLATTRSSTSAASSGGVCARVKAAQESRTASANNARVAVRHQARISETLHHLAHMLDLRRLRKAMADQLAPLGEIGRLAKIDRIVLDGVPLHEQPIARRLLNRSLQRHASAALSAPKQ